MQSNLDLDSGDASRQVPAQPTKEVKDLGRKARERLEEERQKRREIVRLEQDPIETETTSGKPKSAFSQAIRTKRGKQPAAKRKYVAKFCESTEPKEDIDTWEPDINHVSLCADGEASSVVRLHGLPKFVKPESIRRFFSGLDVERIFVLLTNETCIPEWDEQEHDDEMAVARHEASFRVYVKFVSSLAADMARARSEEILYVAPNEKKVGVHIAMTKVPKTIASFLQLNLAIDAVNGCPLHHTLVKEEARLDPRVTNLLWTVAVREFDVSVSSKGTQAKVQWQNDMSELNPLVFSDYQKLARYHNLLVDKFEGMEESEESLVTEERNLEHSHDAAVRLKRAASRRLSEEIERVELTLYRARVERRNSTQSHDTTE